MPRPVFLHQLDEALHRGCDTPGCAHEHGAEIFLTPRCHPGAGVRVEVLNDLSLSRLNHEQPGVQAHPEIVQGTAELHHEIADALLPQPDPVFHN